MQYGETKKAGSRLRSGGLTLLEVLVALSIIGMVSALMVTAVQSVRESARRAQCQNNLQQTMLAVHSFHNGQGTLPSLYNHTTLTYPLREWDLFHMHSWRAVLLPHLEQAALYEHVDLKALATERENAPVAQSVVATLTCPTGPDPTSPMGRGLRYSSITVPPESQTEDDWYHVVRSDYDAMAGIVVLPNPRPADAAVNSIDHVDWSVWGWPQFEVRKTTGERLLRYQAGKFRDITDGLSNTLAIAERGGKPFEYENGELCITEFNPEAEYPGQVGWSASNTFQWALNGSKVGVNVSNSQGIYSFHTAGANVAMADGSVRLLAESTDFATLVELFSRSGGPRREAN